MAQTGKLSTISFLVPNIALCPDMLDVESCMGWREWAGVNGPLLREPKKASPYAVHTLHDSRSFTSASMSARLPVVNDLS